MLFHIKCSYVFILNAHLYTDNLYREEMHPIVLSELGTKAKPVVLKGVDPERYIACTGNNKRLTSFSLYHDFGS